MKLYQIVSKIKVTPKANPKFVRNILSWCKQAEVKQVKR